MSRALILLLLLAGCAGAPAATRIVTLAPELPQPLLSCAADPTVPAASSQAVVANYIVALWEAGEDCRDHMSAIRSALAK